MPIIEPSYEILMWGDAIGGMMPGVVDMGGEHVRGEHVQWDTWLCMWREDVGPGLAAGGLIALTEHYDGRVVVKICLSGRAWHRAYPTEIDARDAVARYLAASPRAWENSPKSQRHRPTSERWRPDWAEMPDGAPDGEVWRTARRQPRR
ncbi:hypothetical protein [Stackebrandtia nassauensis]|uniref:Uncharacterized protein n=1 Tax=Stackebrandtia nassauensis (strain DSM 44728 / CIP 108903 / NRRL B-16338 / NBRC 102104 / LLR-40K-21) TaxID=446470 RepID=D3Q2F6_STANL|nr:hypothetical protein [Stackebrandtia nassauensis]ADD43889.1 hypothetical protein Snas_4240 [Stackebrandtia nassauensis DSM 44728]